MPTSQPLFSPLGILLSVVAIYLLAKSPQKLQTLIRMAVAFVVTVLVFIVPGAILRMVAHALHEAHRQGIVRATCLNPLAGNDAKGLPQHREDA